MNDANGGKTWPESNGTAELLVSRRSGGITHVDLTDPPAPEDVESVQTLVAELIGLVEHGHRSLVLNLHGAGRTTSAWVGLLAYLHRHVGDAGGVLHLQDAGPDLFHALEICRLDGHLGLRQARCDPDLEDEVIPRQSSKGLEDWT
jgi:hypothetical protein